VIPWHDLYPRLFEPGTIGALAVWNRIVFAPVSTGYTENGWPTERLAAHHAARARGGAGLIIVESAYFLRGASRLPNTLVLADDEAIPIYRRLVERIKQAAPAVKVAQQISHAGREMPRIGGRRPVAPSAIASRTAGEVPEALGPEEIQALVGQYARVAVRCRAAGYDAVELHAAHGFLVAQFLSPDTNKRADEYGGDPWRRSRFARDILARIQAEAGADFPVIVRLNGEEPAPGGLAIAGARTIAQLLEEAGANAIHVSGGTAESGEGSISPPMGFPAPCFARLAAEVHRAVNIPVIAVGKIQTPEAAERILAEGQADFVALGRALLADAEWPAKARAGRPETIRPCIACNQACVEQLAGRGETGCTVNPSVGRDLEPAIVPTGTPLCVVVVGGGPAGMEAARVAALGGHRVALLERDKELGGQLRLALAVPHKRELEPYRRYLVRELERLGIEVHLGLDARPETVTRLGAEAVIVATGARPARLEIEGGADLPLLSPWEVLGGRADVGREALVLGGGGLGCDVALALAAQGVQVSLAEAGDELAFDVGRTSKGPVLERLRAARVQCLPATTLARGVDDRLVLRARTGWYTMSRRAIVSTLGLEANVELVEPLRAEGLRVFVVGDAARPRSLLEAVREGAEAARRL
jgi:2,4-dienoyl-CoA reductase-like NADH-dependent reductase (Old Yellow Enzyme family)